MDDDNVRVAGQLAMLKSIIQQMYMAAFPRYFGFRQQAGVVPAGADVDRNPRGARQEQGFVSELLRIPCAINAMNAFARPSIAARQNVWTETVASSSRARQMTSGVLPAPPTERLPMLTTGQRRRCGAMRSKRAFLARTSDR